MRLQDTQLPEASCRPRAERLPVASATRLGRPRSFWGPSRPRRALRPVSCTLTCSWTLGGPRGLARTPQPAGTRHEPGVVPTPGPQPLPGVELAPASPGGWGGPWAASSPLPSQRYLRRPDKRQQRESQKTVHMNGTKQGNVDGNGGEWERIWGKEARITRIRGITGDGVEGEMSSRGSDNCGSSVFRGRGKRWGFWGDWRTVSGKEFGERQGVVRGRWNGKRDRGKTGLCRK